MRFLLFFVFFFAFTAKSYAQNPPAFTVSGSPSCFSLTGDETVTTCTNGQRCSASRPSTVYRILRNGIPLAQPVPADTPSNLSSLCSSVNGQLIEATTERWIGCLVTPSTCTLPPPACTQDPACATPPPAPTSDDEIGVSKETLDDFNAAIFGEGGPKPELTTPRGIISQALPYIFVFGGLLLFIMLLWGGFEMLTGAMNPKSQEAGRQRMTAAVVGFILLFVSYWLAQIVELVFGISIL